MIVAEPRTSASAAALRRLLESEPRPLFTCAWRRAVFLHYKIEPEALQPQVPFPLDLHEGKAYVSLVAFTLERLRLSRGGPAIATHGFLNVRTYVRHAGEGGIYFLVEWLPHPFFVLVGPAAYGLPYRYGRLDYRHEYEKGTLAGRVCSDGRQLRYEAPVDPAAGLRRCEPGSRDEFLLERYTAFTARGLGRRAFRIWHEPWPQVPVEARVLDDRLIERTGPWFRRARLAGAAYSPGFDRVLMGAPRRLE